MIIQVNERRYADAFASVYNSANTLFPPERRCDADETVFFRQLQEDQNFIYVSGSAICGFMSYHKFREYYELTSLYVRREHQKFLALAWTGIKC